MGNIITLEREVLLLRIKLKSVVTFTWMRILAKAGIVLCRIEGRKSHRRTAIWWWRVSWYDAEAYCLWADKRYLWGDEFAHDDAQNHQRIAGRDTWSRCAPVGSFEAN